MDKPGFALIYPLKKAFNKKDRNPLKHLLRKNLLSHVRLAYQAQAHEILS